MKRLVRAFGPVKSLSFARLSAIRLYSTDKDVKQKLEPKPVDEKKEPPKRNIVVEKYAGITTLNIDRSKCRNSLDELTLREIEAAILAFEKDNESKVLIIHGEGGTFCSGFDVDELESKGYNTLLDASRSLQRRPLCDKVTIAAISGYAVAEGFELALACDLRVIEDSAVLGCLGRRFGVPQGLFGGRRLTALIGLSRALDLLITGRAIKGTEAHQMGLAAKLTVTGTALGEAVKLAKSIAKFPQSALVMDKLAAVNSQLNPDSLDSMRDEALAQSLLGQAIQDISTGIEKFKAGIGKHGKFYKLTEVPLKDWELEDSVEEITIKKNEETKNNEKK